MVGAPRARTSTDSAGMLSALRMLPARGSPTVPPLILTGELELSRLLLPVELTTVGLESVDEINRETSEMEQA